MDKLTEALADHDCASDAILGRHIDTLAESARKYELLEPILRELCEARGSAPEFLSFRVEDTSSDFSAMATVNVGCEEFYKRAANLATRIGEIMEDRNAP